MSEITLLLVDDEADHVETLAARLRLRGVTSRTAPSGPEALAMLADTEPVAVVLDRHLPGVDALALIRRIRLEHPNVPVILVADWGTDADEALAREAGAFAYLVKPVTASTLMDSIERAIQASARTSPDRSREQPVGTPGPPETVAARKSIRVLIVDDERDSVRTLAQRMDLWELGGTVAFSGREALELLEEDRPDVMVLGLRMKELDGLEVLRRVKGRHPEIEVVILTGHGTPEAEAEARRLGAFRFLNKPVGLDALVDVVQRAAARSTRAPH